MVSPNRRTSRVLFLCPRSASLYKVDECPFGVLTFLFSLLSWTWGRMAPNEAFEIPSMSEEESCLSDYDSLKQLVKEKSL